MKRVWGHVLAGLSLLAGAGVASSACVHDDSTLFIRGALLQGFQQNGMVCQYTQDPMQPFTWSGTLDVALRDRYDAVFLVGNQMVPQINPNQLQTETSIVKIDGAIVRITDRAGKQLSTFTRLTAAEIPPSSGGVPGYAPVRITIVDPVTIQTNQAIQGYILMGQGFTVRLVTYVRFFGKSLGGQSIESNEFEFPVDVCDGLLPGGCLIKFTNNPLYPQPNCVGNAASGTATTQPQIPCAPGQDLSIDCSACTGLYSNCNGAYQAIPVAVDAGSG